MIILKNADLLYLRDFYRYDLRDENDVVFCINETSLDEYFIISVHAPKDCSFKLFLESFVFWKTFDKYNPNPPSTDVQRLKKFYRNVGLSNSGVFSSSHGPYSVDILLSRENLNPLLDYCKLQEEAFGEQAFYRNQRLELTKGEARTLEMFGYYGSRLSMDILKLVECLMNSKSILWLHDLLHDPEIEQAVASKINLHPMMGMPTPPVCAMSAYVLNYLKWPQFHISALHAYATQNHFIFDGIADGHRLSYRYELARYLSDLHARYPILLQTLSGETVDVFAHLEEWFPKWLFSDSNE